MREPIKTGTRNDGSTYYWFRISGGFHPITGKQIRVYRSFDKLKAAQTEHARLVSEINGKKFAAPDKITVSEYLDRWEPAHGRDLEEGSRSQIHHALARVRDKLGDRKFQSLTRADIDALVDWLLTSGRKRGGKPGTGLGARSVQLTLVHFQRACDDAIDDRIITVNPCRRVKRPKDDRPEHELWTDEQTAKFDATAAADRLHPVITLQCLGLRPEEVCGLRWKRDLNLGKRTIRIQVVRTLVDGAVVEKPPKSDAGKRTLPLDDALTEALRAFQLLQAREKLAAGEAYSRADYVLCDELGRPSDPARLRRVWYRLMREAGVPKIKPYTASRHAAGSYLSHAGVSPDIIAAWLGHADASFTMRTYIHARPEDLAAARDALGARRSQTG
jgi:integrase